MQATTEHGTEARLAKPRYRGVSHRMAFVATLTRPPS